MTEKEIKILDDTQARADAFLAAELNVARNQALNLIKSGLVSLNGKPLNKPSAKLNLGDVLRVKFEQNEPDTAKFEAKFEIDKKTLFPKSYSMKVSMKAGENEKQMSLDMDSKTEFSEINQIKEIVLPDEVKNAKEWKGNN